MVLVLPTLLGVFTLCMVGAREGLYVGVASFIAAGALKLWEARRGLA